MNPLTDESMGKDKETGGFFGLELPVYDNFPQFHEGRGVLLNSGRCALEYILRSLGEVRKVYLSHYTCHTVIEPLERLGISFDFYRINPDLEVEESSLPVLRDGEYMLYTNYFGIKEDYIDNLSGRFAGHLILDCTLALYSPPRRGIPSFYSPRKFSGVADGGVAVMDNPTLEVGEQDVSWEFSSYLLQRLEQGVETSADACEQNEKRLCGAPMLRMSVLTERLIQGIDYMAAAEKRLSHFQYLHKRLKGLNKLTLDDGGISAPFCYPLWTNMSGLRNEIIDNRILIPCLWPHVLESAPAGSLERNLAFHLLPLPVDQRCDMEDLDHIVRAVEAFYA